MTLQKLASAIAKREGKNSQWRLGDIREILKLICTLEAEMLVAGVDVYDCPLVALDTRVAAMLGKVKRKAKVRM